MHIPLINSLYGRIFAIFWLCTFLAVLGIVIVTSLDPKKPRDIPELRYQKILDIRDAIEAELSSETNTEEIIKRLEWAPNIQVPLIEDSSLHDDDKQSSIFNQFFLVDFNGNLLTENPSGDAYKAVRNFSTRLDISDNPNKKPQQKQYGIWVVSGPFSARLGDQNFLLYQCITLKLGDPVFSYFVLESPVRLLFVVMLLSTPVLLLLSWPLSQPARRLEKAALRVSQGMFEIDPSLERGTPEFKKAGVGFNLMVGSLNNMISRQQRLLSDMSHELRSPLTRLSLAQSLAVRKQGDDQYLERIRVEADNLERMIAELIELSRMHVDSHLKRQEQPIQSLWEGLLQDAKFETEEIGKTFILNDIPDRHILCYPEFLMSALENTIKNAIFYSKDQIQVTFEDKGEHIRICVEDNGEGVSENELELIFKPFYRASESLDRHSGGSGLGLATTQNAIRQHNGKIHVARSRMGGLLIEIELPLV